MDYAKLEENLYKLEPRLYNWKLCYKDSPSYKRANSLEGNYREPAPTKEMLEQLKGQTFESKATTRQNKMMNDAAIIEAAVVNLPMKHKMVLVCSVMYPYLLVNSAFAKTCHVIGISRKAEVFDDLLKKAKIMLLKELYPIDKQSAFILHSPTNELASA